MVYVRREWSEERGDKKEGKEMEMLLWIFCPSLPLSFFFLCIFLLLFIPFLSLSLPLPLSLSSYHGKFSQQGRDGVCIIHLGKRRMLLHLKREREREREMEREKRNDGRRENIFYLSSSSSPSSSFPFLLSLSLALLSSLYFFLVICYRLLLKM